MRLLGCLAALAVAVSWGCSPSASPEASSGNRYDALANVLGSCQAAQKAAMSELESSSVSAAGRSLAVAEAACKAAAANLRETPIPSLNSKLAAEGIDDMAAGLGQISRATKMLHGSPRAARAKAQAGMARYKAGLEKTQRAAA